MSAEAGYALLGAGIGGAASIITTLITIRHEGSKARDQREHEMRLELGRKELELKSNTVADINESIMRIIVPIMRVEEKNIAYHIDHEGNLVEPSTIRELEKARDDEYYNNFIIRSYVIQSNIQTYFAGCLRQWNVLMDLVKFVRSLSDRWEFDDRATFIQNHSVEFDRKLSEYEPVGETAEDEDNTRVFQTLLEAATARFNRRNSSEEPIDDARFTEIVANRDMEAWHDLKNAIMDKKDELVQAILNTEIPMFNLDKK